MQQRVGFIGLGLMGKPMAQNILRAGFPLVVHNRSRGKVTAMVAEGATAASSPADLTRQVDVVLSCLPKPADVERVYLEDDGVVNASHPGQILIEMSTIDVATHRKIAEAARARGAFYMDAPVSGGTGGAAAGTLSIMCGGDAETFDHARPVLGAMGKNLYHVGPVGSGAVVKLINNMMNSINAMGVSEGLVMGAKAGIDPDLLLDILTMSSGASRTLDGARSTILAGNFAPGFAIDLMAKDVRLATELAQQLGVRLLAGSLAHQVLTEAVAAGLGTEGTPAQIRVLEQNAGVEVRSKKGH